jgi:ParB family chromosome partitioning protein
MTMKITLSKIHPNPKQPRKVFDQAEIERLAATMKNPKVGQLQAILVEPGPDDTYILVDGERRTRAARLLGWTEIEATIGAETNHNGVERLVKAFVANDNRVGMNPVEKALAYDELLREYGDVRTVCEIVGKSDATVYSHLSLLRLEKPVQDLFARGKIQMSPRTIAAIERLAPEMRTDLATRLAVRGASVSVFLSLCKRYETRSSTTRSKREDFGETPAQAGTQYTALNLVAKKKLRFAHPQAGYSNLHGLRSGRHGLGDDLPGLSAG